MDENEINMDRNKINEEISKTQDNLFFIIGSGRCGTTLVQAILNSHSKICLPIETHFYTEYKMINYLRYRKMNKKTYLQAIDEVECRWRNFNLKKNKKQFFDYISKSLSPSWDSLFLSFLTAHRLGEKKEIVGEKTPGHIRKIEKLSKKYKNAKFIHLIRDPRAVVSSYINKDDYQFAYGDNLARAILKWRRSVKKQYEMNENFEESRYLTVFYENFVKNPDQELRDLLDFLNIKYDPNIWDEYFKNENKSYKEKKAHQKVGQEIDQSRINAWMNNLNDRQIKIIERLSGRKNMLSLGYSPKFESSKEEIFYSVKSLASFFYKSIKYAIHLIKNIGI